MRTTAERGGEQQLAIWGASGVGKSHLLNAACQAASAHQRTAAYLPLKELIEQPPELLLGLEEIAVVAIDDIDLLVDYPDWQFALFNLINRARQSQTSILTASIKNPASLDVLPDLVSRLVWGPVLRVQTPGDELLAEAVTARAQSLSLGMPNEVSRYLLSHYSRELGRLYLALSALDRASLVEQRRLTIPFVKTVLHDLKG